MTGGLFHAAIPEDWERAQTQGAYTISTRGQALDEVGFVHCSYESQLETVANRFYGDLYELVLLTIDPDQLNVPVIAESTEDSAELFPHVYGPIPLHAVTEATMWRRDTTGRFALPARSIA